jgi:pimeloyl-ACP methyl ester carboxylesterase
MMSGHATNAQSKGAYATVNGLKMYYEIHGSGKIPLVLIHGGGSTIETTFGTILPMLAKHRKIIAVELQAHGRTSDREGPVTFEQDADDVAALLQFLTIEKADFFGFSNGGSTAMQIGIRHPGIVHKLVIASAAYKRSGFITGFFDGMLNATLDNMPALLKEGYLKVAPDKSKLQGMFEKDKNRMIAFKDWPDESVRSIQAPALIINADHDVVTNEHTVEMSHTIPHTELMIVPGMHGAYLGEITTIEKGSKIPELTAMAIEQFLNK